MRWFRWPRARSAASFQDVVEGRMPARDFLEGKISAYLTQLSAQVADAGDQLAIDTLASYELVVMPKSLNVRQEYFVLLALTTALEGLGPAGLNKLIAQQTQIDQMTGGSIGLDPMIFANQLLETLPNTRQVRNFLHARCQRFKTLVDIELAIVNLRKLGDEQRAVELEKQVQRLTEGLR